MRLDCTLILESRKASVSGNQYELLYSGGGSLDPSNSVGELIFAQSDVGLEGNVYYAREHLRLTKQYQKIEIVQGLKPSETQSLWLMDMQILTFYVD